MVDKDKSSCPHDPRLAQNQPIGMYHCPICGEMVVAGMDHPNYDWLDNKKYNFEFDYEDTHPTEKRKEDEQD